MISAWWLLLAFVVGQVSVLIAVAFVDGNREKGGEYEDE